MIVASVFSIFVLSKADWVNYSFAAVAGGAAAYLLICLILKLLQLKQSIRFFQNQWLTFGMSLAVGLVSNSIYSVAMIGIGVYSQSPWYLTVAFYHMILTFQKLLITVSFHKHREDKFKAWRTYQLVGYAILGLSLALVGTIILVIHQEHHLKSGFNYALLIALYTFTMLVVSLMNVIKAIKFKHPLLIAARNVNLATSLFSVFTLQTIMLQTFNRDNKMDWTSTSAITGLVIFTILNTIAVLMIIRARKEIKK